MSDLAVEAGKAAWARLKGDRVTFDDWVAVGRALLVGRAHCMAVAKVNAASGGRYNYIATHWLEEHGFHGITNQERSMVVKLVENIEAVSAWRDGLDESHRRKLNHPSVWLTYCKATKPKTAQHVVANVGRPMTAGKGKGLSQDMIRRAGDAMRESRSSDWYTLARIALQSTGLDFDALRIAEPEAA